MMQYVIMELSEHIQRLLGEIRTMADTQNRILESLERIEDRLVSEDK